MSFIPTELAVVGNKFLVEYLGEQYPCSIAEVGITPVFDPSNERILG
jgi:glycine cleavage system aminomethyltransferase T